ncbi:hypothetical protein [Bosea sp. (in: a-proteobacteria)]|uniref:hypothetical protein n=1 Tax=Bosea sp. (in: a-proteobacteria) TaxID=1871050 RepID=UPI0027352A95|nr:hypothetical protein [Bosea sp. (in: a-proteobacteria)]MDP3407790.1 hypothetical protein [Bosea sp. (in: a-proteobacteria)]
MTKLLQQALAATEALSPDMQDELARQILAFTARESEVYQLSEEELAALDEADRGGFASDDEVAALWTKAGP